MEDDRLLLKILRTVLIPNFVKEDLPVFNTIMQDLFPGVKVPQRHNEELVESLRITARIDNLQITPEFIEKALELHDTIKIRHTNMLIGPSGGGKTTILKTLAKALSKLPKESQINLHFINPKSVTMDELYGFYSEKDSLWHDGIFTSILKDCTKDLSDEKHWIVLDGPIDSIWV